jgi:hypothetical protein
MYMHWVPYPYAHLRMESAYCQVVRRKIQAWSGACECSSCLMQCSHLWDPCRWNTVLQYVAAASLTAGSWPAKAGT